MVLNGSGFLIAKGSGPGWASPAMGDLKAASLGKDPQVALSKAWNVVKRHQGIYSGGKVRI